MTVNTVGSNEERGACPLRGTVADALAALTIRELTSRLGGGWRGLLPLLGEPLLHVLTLLVILGATARTLLPGIDPLPFFAAGVIAFLAFRSTVSQVSNAIIANRPLFFYKQVQPAYTFVPRTAVEVLVMLAVAALVQVIGAAMGHFWTYSTPLRLLHALALLFLLGAGLGALSAVTAQIWEFARTLAPSALRVLYYVSCVFYPLFLVPGAAQEAFLLNPIVHVLEEIRYCLVAGYPAPSATSLPYVWAWILCSWTATAALYAANLRKMY